MHDSCFRSTRVRAAAALAAILLAVAAPAVDLDLHAQRDPNQIVAPELFADLRWRNVGAARGGRVTAFAGVRQQPHTFYAGATGGGVWKTEDAGIRWYPVGDGQITTGSIGAIDVAPSNPDHVWVGTGSAAIRSNVIIGRGVFKSTDAGRTFSFAGLKEVGQIGTIRVHPRDPNTVWVAASGSPYGPTRDRGIYKTTDGGATWRKTLYVDEEHGARDVEVDWNDPNVLYAATYRGFRKGWDIISGGPADKGGIWKSTDGGETWKKITAGLPSTLIGKIDLDIARSNPKVLYAIIEAPGPEGGLYKSTDAGESWTLVNNSPQLRNRPFYFHYVNVSPKDENTVFVSELRFHKSTDGGRTFTQIPTTHGDNHGMWINPDNPDIFLQVNDGGASVTLNGGKSWSTLLNQPHAEYYMVAVDDQYPYRLYVPQQDNTTLIVPSLPPVSWGFDHPAQFWVQASGCETGGIWPRRDGSVVWGACKGEVGRYNVMTGQEQHYWIYPQNRYGHDPDDIRFRFPRQTVIFLSPHDERVIYQASHVVHRSTDEGVTWETISPDLTAHEPEYQIVSGNPITRDITGEEVYSAIYSMVESRLERGVLWVGANDGPVHVSRDNGKTWTNVTPKGLPPGGRVQNIEDSPHRKGSAYIAVYRYLREHDLRPYIYRTDDYGASWTLLTDGTNGIPSDFPTRVVREDPAREGLLYAGTEFGIFVSFDNGAHWQSLQQNLPATPVTDIRVHRNDLVISTMGRSLWIMDNVTPLQQAASLQTETTAMHLFQPRDAIRYRYPANAGGAGEPEYPPPGAHLDLWFRAEPPADATLEILDPKGQVIRTFGVAPAPARTSERAESGMRPARSGGAASGIRRAAGMQRLLWDMRHAGPWTPSASESGGGPMAAPGRYTVRLHANGQTQTRSFELKVDPRVTRDGVTQSDLEAQETFLLRVRDAISEARRLQHSIEQALQKAGLDARLPPAAPGRQPADLPLEHPLQRLLARIADQPGTYPQPMLISQLANVQRMVGQADQKVPREATGGSTIC